LKWPRLVKYGKIPSERDGEKQRVLKRRKKRKKRKKKKQNGWLRGQGLLGHRYMDVYGAHEHFRVSMSPPQAS